MLIAELKKKTAQLQDGLERSTTVLLCCDAIAELRENAKLYNVKLDDAKLLLHGWYGRNIPSDFAR